MKRFLAKYNDRGAWKVTFDESTTWPQVLEEATQAFDDYTKRGRSWRHPFRSTQRLFGSVACRIKFLVVLLPDGDFTGALCGGLCLIYNVSSVIRHPLGIVLKQGRYTGRNTQKRDPRADHPDPRLTFSAC